MKIIKLLVLSFILTFAFAFDFNFTKAFQNFKQGTKLLKTNPKLAEEKFQTAFNLLKGIKNKTSQVYYMLGKMYCNGWGVEKNYKLAEINFLNAIKLGNQRANCCLARLYFKMGKTDLAEKYLNKALENKHIKNYCDDLIKTNLNKE